MQMNYARRVLAASSRLMFVVCLAPSMACAVFLPRNAEAQTYTKLWSFCSESNCADGSTPDPSSQLLRDSRGDLFGVTAYGGDDNDGVVFELIYKGGNYSYKRLYSFCQDTDCADGTNPLGNLVMDSSGDIYGTTQAGGANSNGTVFELTPHGAANSGKTKWTSQTLWRFCAAVGTCSEGSYPVGGLSYEGASSGALYDGTSPLFVILALGGGSNFCNGGCGAVDEIVPPAAGKTARTAKRIYSFCSLRNCRDGGGPTAGLLSDAGGNLYGATAGGGNFGAGVAFLLKANAPKTQWSEEVLHAFCAHRDGNNNCPDGVEPSGRLVLDQTGTVYGVSAAGGEINAGIVFELDPRDTSYKFTRMYSFCADASTCADGSNPTGGLVADANGFLYGTSHNGGQFGTGAIYQISPQGAHSPESVLYSLCVSQGGCSGGSDGTGGGPLIIDRANNLYGISMSGGDNNDGAVFKFHP